MSELTADEPCVCCCPDGACGHQWDGPQIEIKGGMLDGAVTVTCSRCGTTAIHHDWKVGP